MGAQSWYIFFLLWHEAFDRKSSASEISPTLRIGTSSNLLTASLEKKNRNSPRLDKRLRSELVYIFLLWHEAFKDKSSVSEVSPTLRIGASSNLLTALRVKKNRNSPRLDTRLRSGLVYILLSWYKVSNEKSSVSENSQTLRIGALSEF